jgi:hypothetical protein
MKRQRARIDTTSCVSRSADGAHDNVHDAIAQLRAPDFSMAQKCRWCKGFRDVPFFDDCSEQGKRATRVRLQALATAR